MRNPDSSDAYQVTWLVRRLFRAMGQKADQSLEAFGLSAADRAVLEFLYPDKRLSVPEIAERYGVSRQHIQVTVNNLLDKQLLMTRNNPRHKRSPLVVLRKQGQVLFKRILSNDVQIITQLFAEIPEADIRRTRATLEVVLQRLNTGDLQ